MHRQTDTRTIVTELRPRTAENRWLKKNESVPCTNLREITKLQNRSFVGKTCEPNLAPSPNAAETTTVGFHSTRLIRERRD